MRNFDRGAPMSILRLPQNDVGRDFVVGDVHGAFHLVDIALDRAGFDPASDRLFFVGDLIDRGPASERCVEFLARPSVYAVRGNHEDMLLELYADGEPAKEALNFCASRNGFRWWLTTPDETRACILAAISSLPYAIEVQTSRGLVGIVHADVPSGMTWQDFCAALEADTQNARETALWGRKRVQSQDLGGVPGIDRVFVGHTPQWGGVRRYGNVYAVDTGGVFGAPDHDGHLTMAEICCRTDALISAPRMVQLVELRDEPTDNPQLPFGKYGVTLEP